MDNANWQEVIKIDVNITNIEKVESNNSQVVMISFDGTASGEFFNGSILPGAVDTQKQISDKMLSLSARYILSGKDFMDQNCKIFIENNGIVKEGDNIFYATPKILTDSTNLKWLESASLESHVIPHKNGVEVLIFSTQYK
ncbi:DUF3237 family protein [Thiospirochaeta perfilievii]|nr:DUF3237 family protein [Thiospirochaeta perfilievii]